MPKQSGLKVKVFYETTPGSGTFNAFACQRSATLSLSQDNADATNKDDNNYNFPIPTIRDWTVDTEGVIIAEDADYKKLRDMWINQEVVLIRIQNDDAAFSPAQFWEGNVFIDTLDEEAPHDDTFSHSATLQGQGVLTPNNF